LQFADCSPLRIYADKRYAAQSKEICGFEIFGLAYLRNLGIFDCELSPKICGFNKICKPIFAKLPLVHLEL
jgi:hypothetical protein